MPNQERVSSQNKDQLSTSSGKAGGTGSSSSSSGLPADEPASDTVDWQYEADVVIVGGGCVGLVAAIRARDLGASVILIEQNFDLGGKMSHSLGRASLGGGDPIQERDRFGLDPENMGLTEPLVAPEDLEDDPDRLFTDYTDWSVVNDAAIAEYRYNDPKLHRALADNASAVRQLMLDNYVRFSRITGTHVGGGMTRARAPWAIMKLSDKTDIEAGEVSREHAGSIEEERSSPFNPQVYGPAPSASDFGAPGWVVGGFAIARPLEHSARKKGVRILLNRHMDELIREQPFAGRAIGIKASYSPRFHPETGARLESFWSDNNIEDSSETLFIRAKRAVIIGSGGYQGNINFRSMFDPRMREPSIQFGSSLMGPRHGDASGIIAAMKIGANLAGMMHQYGHDLGTPRLSDIIGSSDANDAVFPGHPAFHFCRAYGIHIGRSGWEHLIAVNQVGERFYDEMSISANVEAHATYPPGGGTPLNHFVLPVSTATRNPFRQRDWRNSSVSHIKQVYNHGAASDAALGLNKGSVAPDFLSGPVWAIFDQAAVDRTGWKIRYPFIAHPSDGFFVKADTIDELARMMAQNPFQKEVPAHLAQTIANYNKFCEKGHDPDFDKPALHRIDQPPYYAAIIPLAVTDSYGGLRINEKAQVEDTAGKVIEGLYAAGEASGGSGQHGIGLASITGFIAATNAAS